MAFTVGDIQSQVQLLTGHDGLADRVITWTNRVLNDMGTRAFWSNQIGVGFAQHTNLTSASSGNLRLNSFTMQTPNTNFHEFVAPYAVDQVVMGTGTGTQIQATSYNRPLVRLELPDFYAQAVGGTAGVYTSSTSECYAMVKGTVDTASTGGTVYEHFVGGPFPASTASTGASGQVMGVMYLGTPAKVTTATDTNWIIQKYLRVVLAGVMRYARLYLGDAMGYYVEKAEYENGIRDMLLAEEAPSANTPVMRGVDSGLFGRNP